MKPLVYLKNEDFKLINSSNGLSRLFNTSMAQQNFVGIEGNLIFDNNLHKLIDFATGAYLGLNYDFQIQDFNEAKKWGMRNGWSRFSGTTSPGLLLENLIAQELGLKKCKLAQSISLLNYTSFRAFKKQYPVILIDEDAHITLKEGAKGAYSKNEIIYFCNNDIKDLEDKIKEISLFGQRVLIAIDGIYSMKGTMAPIQAISKLCQKYSSHCYIDDAHGFGVIGDNGLGVLESIEKDERANFTYVGSFSKPCSNPVAFIASNIDIETKVGGLVYSGPPSNIHIIASLRYFNEFTSNSFIEKRKRIQINSEYLHNFCYKLGLESFSQSGSSILTLKIFPHNVEKIIESFYQSNIFLKAAIYPVVRKGDEILRFTITSNHSDSDIQHLCYAIEQYQDLIKGKNN